MGNAPSSARSAPESAVRGWPEVRSEILRHLRTDGSVYVTTMVDYYGMPGDSRKASAWPGRHGATALPIHERGNHVESALTAEIENELRESRRFIPFVVMHEFEAILFSDCERFAIAIGRSELQADLLKVRNAFKSPEDINDSPKTHPSQRILDLFPEFRKPLHGAISRRVKSVSSRFVGNASIFVGGSNAWRSLASERSRSEDLLTEARTQHLLAAQAS